MAAGLTAYALSNDGLLPHRADLNDGGVWTTSAADEAFGRMNRPVEQIDLALRARGEAAATTLDVLQDGPAVVALAGTTAFPIDVVTGKLLQDEGIATRETTLDLRGGTLAHLDDEGRLRASRVEAQDGVVSLAGLDKDVTPLAKPGAGSLVVVGADGTVRAVTPEGEVWQAAPAGDGFAKPTREDETAPTGAVAVTTVGAALAVLDESGQLAVSGGEAEGLADGVLQQPGPAADQVLVATSTSLLAVDLATGRSTTIAEGISAEEPVQPVRVGGCDYAAWNGTPGVLVTRCGSGAADAPVELEAPDFARSSDLVFRVNRGQVVLNDRATGAVWIVDEGEPRQAADWSSALVQPQTAEGDPTESTDPGATTSPIAQDDDFGVRPGNSAVLNVLDNDGTPNERAVLNVEKLDAPSRDDIRITMSADRQTLLVETEASFESPISFQYSVGDGRHDGVSRPATVTVVPRVEGNSPPRLRPGYKAPELTVPAGDSIAIPVLTDWRDYADSDPLLLDQQVQVAQGSVQVTADGRVKFTAPAEGRGPVKIRYAVSDGADQTPQVIAVEVQARANKEAVAPQARPDVARGEVGGTITIRPLDNDLPGADPREPAARLELAAELPDTAWADVETDLLSGEVRVTPTQAGTRFLTYRAVYGSSATSGSQVIRVDVDAPAGEARPPQATPDQAIIRGESPTTVDVLANDLDPGGRLLAVQSAEPAIPNAPLTVAVVEGRWLRISPAGADISPNPQPVHYLLSNGSSPPVRGTVVVTQVPPPSDNSPVVEDDEARVRVGTSVTIPVLDNDSTPSGDPVGLQVDNADGRAGALKVVSGPGSAFVSGRTVRYVAPDTLPDGVQEQAIVEYVAVGPDGSTTGGRIRVTVTPPPSDDNQAPAPPSLEGRVVAGDTVTLTLPTVGADPDGDPVMVVGLVTPPELGGLVRVGATSLTYQAFPNSPGGTDEFTFLVTDIHGAEAEARARVAVLPTGTPQAPVAVDDIAFAEPGATLTIDALANDTRPPGVEVFLTDVVPATEDQDRVSVSEVEGSIEVVAGDPKDPVSFPYTVTDGMLSSQGQVTVRSIEGFNNIPVVADVFAEVDGVGDTTAAADLLKDAYDPDSRGTLSVELFSQSAGTLDGGVLTVDVDEQPQAIPFRVIDDRGGATVATVWVPGNASSAPYLRDEEPIRIDPGTSRSVALADLVEDPSGGDVTIFDPTVVGSPVAVTGEAADRGTALRVSADRGYTGPGFVTFSVSNGESLTDQTAATAILTKRVEVGDVAPVITCPREPIVLVQGGKPITLPIGSLCHAWTADPADRADLTFTSSWSQDPGDVEISGNGDSRVTLTPGEGARPGSRGVLEVAVDGFKGATSEIPVRVIEAPPLVFNAVREEGHSAGDEFTVDLTPYLVSPLADPSFAVVSARNTSQVDSRISVDGPRVRVRIGDDVNGLLTIAVTATDTTAENRLASGVIRVPVVSRPSPPGTPVPGRTVLSQSVLLSWSAPRDNGGLPIDRYRVKHSDGSQECRTSPCLITGLKNGDPYRFAVEAHNAEGWSDASGQSVTATPDKAPGNIRSGSVTDAGDGWVKLDWTRPDNDGSAITHYVVYGYGGPDLKTAGPRPSLRVSGLSNMALNTFNIKAVNQFDESEIAYQIQAQSTGRPASPSGVNSAAISTTTDTPTVEVTWRGLVGGEPNGPTPVTYTVRRNGAEIPGCVNIAATSCRHGGISFNGDSHRYTVTATNAATRFTAGKNATSAPSAPYDYKAVGTPGAWGNWTIAPLAETSLNNEANSKARITYTLPDLRGASGTVTIRPSGGSAVQFNHTQGQEGQTFTRDVVVGTNGANHSVRLELVNEESARGTSTSDTKNVNPYGPRGNFTLEVVSTNNGTVVWRVSGNPNGRSVTVSFDGTANNGSANAGSGTSSWSGTFSDNVGAGNTSNVTVVISDGIRPEQRLTGSRASDPPPPPPPSPTVTAGKTGNAAGQPGCSDPSCAYITATTRNFPGNVTCRVSATSAGTAGFIPWTQGPNTTDYVTANYFGWPNGWVQVTCGGVTSPRFNW